MKLPYTPLQLAAAARGGGGSRTPRQLDGMPVVCCSLHSQVAPVCAALTGCASPTSSSQGGALPLALSDTVRALRARGLIARRPRRSAPCFGGDVECVNVVVGARLGEERGARRRRLRGRAGDRRHRPRARPRRARCRGRRECGPRARRPAGRRAARLRGGRARAAPRPLAPHAGDPRPVPGRGVVPGEPTLTAGARRARACRSRTWAADPTRIRRSLPRPTPPGVRARRLLG